MENPPTTSFLFTSGNRSSPQGPAPSPVSSGKPSLTTQVVTDRYVLFPISLLLFQPDSYLQAPLTGMVVLLAAMIYIQWAGPHSMCCSYPHEHTVLPTTLENEAPFWLPVCLKSIFSPSFFPQSLPFLQKETYFLKTVLLWKFC